MKLLEGKTALITGAARGIGKAIALKFAEEGANIAFTDLEINEETEKEIAAKGVKAKSYASNAADFAQTEEVVKQVKEEFGSIDILVNNAGFISLDRQETKEGMERQFGINHLGHFLLTTQLLDLMVPGSRIVVVASGAHKVGNIHFDDINLTKGYNVVKAYSQSKLANVLFTRELARRLKKRRISVNCRHPGAVATNMGVDRETGFGKTITGLLKPFFLTPAEGAKTAVYLATDEAVRNKTGGYYYRCKPAKSSKRSKDRELAKKLFEFSEDLVRE
jgi:NAD(P)-dependent dehydrogenase (short-subunit alcohol dehydrogenase family)